MNSSLAKEEQYPYTSETNNKVIPLPGLKFDECFIPESEGEKDSKEITVKIPKGFNFKIILEPAETSLYTGSTLNDENIKNIPKRKTDDLYNETNCDIIRQIENNTYIKKIVDTGVVTPVNDKEEVILSKNRILQKQMSFLFTGMLFVILSFVGIFLFYRFNFYIVHPIIYSIVLLMGLGWSFTALLSIKNNRM